MSINFKGDGIAWAVKNIVKSGRMPHAFLIECDDGDTALSSAWYLAAVCLCEGEDKPCGNCSSCRLIAGQNHPDISVLAPEKGKKSISVAAVRELRSDAFVRAHSDCGKVFIIDGAHKMNVQAQNALLKVLEEPPAGVYFVLTTPSRALLLETVVSRSTLLMCGAEKTSLKENRVSKAAKEFVSLLDSGSELELLKILYPFEKNRSEADELMNELEKAITDAVRQNLKNTAKLRRLNRLFSDIREYKKQLALNINLALLFSAMVSKIKS